jgi:hypothetical protein
MSASLSERSEQCKRSEGTCFSSPSDDKVGGDQARSTPGMFPPPICRRSRERRLADGQTPAVGCSLSTASSAGSLSRCLPRTEEKVQTLLSRNDTGVTIAIVISCAQ